ncbi:VOC family protein [Wenyingzhuangia sp. IMCC45574]
MKLEHFAINVPEPVEMAEWYVANLGMKITLQEKKAPFMTFLADNSGRVMIEIYRHETADIPNYKELNPLIVHLAFVTETIDKDRDRLIEAGATLYYDTILEDGSHLVMLQDPWGVAIQLCKRATPLLLDKEV